MSDSVIALDLPPSSSSVTAVSSSPTVATLSVQTATCQASLATSMVTQQQFPSTSLALYSQMPDLLWKPPRFINFPATVSQPQLVSADCSFNQKRSFVGKKEHADHRDFSLRENDVDREVAKQKEYEKRQEKEKQERDRIEKQKAEQAVREHFTKSQTLGYKKSSCWNFLGSGLSTSTANTVFALRAEDDEKKRIERNEEPSARSESKESENVPGLLASITQCHNTQIQVCSIGGQNEFAGNRNVATSVPSVTTHNRCSDAKLKNSSPISKCDAVFGQMYGCSSFSQPLNYASADRPKKEPPSNSDAIHSLTAAAMTVKNRTSVSKEHDASLSLASVVIPPGDGQSTVIVKNEAKNIPQNAHASPELLKSAKSAAISYSTNSKNRLRTDPYHLQSPPNAKTYDYYSPSRSPLHTTVTHLFNAAGGGGGNSVHQIIDQKFRLSPSTPSSQHRRSPLPLPPYSRRSPLHRRSPPLATNFPPLSDVTAYACSAAPFSTAQPLCSAMDVPLPPQHQQQQLQQQQHQQQQTVPRYTKSFNSGGTNSPSCIASSTLLQPQITCLSAPVTAAVKPKVGSPVPSQIYGKPTSGLPPTDGIVCRSSPAVGGGANSALSNPKVLITPSPFQQLSQHQLPPNVATSSDVNCAPPPAHSGGRSFSMLNDFGPFVSVDYENAKMTRDAVADVGGASSKDSIEKTLSDQATIIVADLQPLDLGRKEQTRLVGVVTVLESEKSSASRGVGRFVSDVDVDADANDDRVDRIEKNTNNEASSRTLPVSPSPPPSSPTRVAADRCLVSVRAGESETLSSPSACSSLSSTPSAETGARTASPSFQCGGAATVQCKAASFVSDNEKSNSPKPPNYSGHKLKKTWLQRHSGKDFSDDKNEATVLFFSTNAGTATKSLAAAAVIPRDISTTAARNANESVNPPVGAQSKRNKSAKNDDENARDSPPTSVIVASTTIASAGAATSPTIPTTTSSASSSSSPHSSFENVESVARPPNSASSSTTGVGSVAVSNATEKGNKKNDGRGISPNGGADVTRRRNRDADVCSDDSSNSDAELKKSPPPPLPPPPLLPSSSRSPIGDLKRNRRTGVDRGGGSGDTSAAASSAEESPKRRKLHRASSTDDSEKGSASEKECDSNCGKKAASASGYSGGEGGGGGSGKDDKKSDSARKRGRKPKISNNYSSNDKSDSNSNDEPKEKKYRDESRERGNPFYKAPVTQLKKSGESFLQDGPCHEVAPKLAKCRECRWTLDQRSNSNSNIFCRFYAFRRLKYTKSGQLSIAGFSDPYKDARIDDLNLWQPNTNDPPSDLDLEVARFTLVQIGDQFCDLLTQEAEAIDIHMSEAKKIAWKRVVQGVREMCDVCETTLFNFHWACGKCGFVVCIDCYKGRKNGTVKMWRECGNDRDDLSWLLCTNRMAHEQEKLMLTQIIAGDALTTLAQLSHETRAMWDIAMFCGCALAANAKPDNDGVCKEILRNLKQEKQKKAEQTNGRTSAENSIESEIKKRENDSPLNWLADVALSNQNKTSAEDECDSSDDSEDGNFSTLRELLVRPSNKNASSAAHDSGPSSPPVSSHSTVPNATTALSSSCSSSSSVNKSKHKKSLLENFDLVLSNVGECIDDNADDYHLADRFINNGGVELKYFVRERIKSYKGRGQLPIRVMTLSESKLLYPDVPHSWLCDGKLLRLLDSTHPGNYTIFQDQWRRGQPVIVSDVSKRLDDTLWRPESFIKDFGDVKNDLINCMTGNVVPNQQMRKFWEGFEYLSRRLKDDKGNDMLLKLKDWPPGEDFAEMLPSRYNDLMNVLPLSEYTQRNGRLNLASRLPECFVRPDLGPKMYNAYGSAMFPNKGTTNLHLDISDAVNVMVYVGIPKDGDCEEHIKEAYRAIDEAGCDILTRRRIREKGELPGALWHIYSARDADKIRDLLNKVAIERGDRLEPNHDPIHDQSCYLDGSLRERLFKEYSVEGYAIVQCMGDAVFVPAGAPHQVRNLHNCIKVAEDFVSPENVAHCFHLTQEFRNLSDTHSNHEDKLQIKNIMYHAVKDSLSVLGATVLRNSVKYSAVESKNVTRNCKEEPDESS